MLITRSVEYILRILQAKNIAFSSYDLASDEDAKRLWRRKAPLGEQCPVASNSLREMNLVVSVLRQAAVARDTSGDRKASCRERV